METKGACVIKKEEKCARTRSDMLQMLGSCATMRMRCNNTWPSANASLLGWTVLDGSRVEDGLVLCRLDKRRRCLPRTPMLLAKVAPVGDGNDTNVTALTRGGSSTLRGASAVDTNVVCGGGVLAAGATLRTGSEETSGLVGEGGGGASSGGDGGVGGLLATAVMSMVVSSCTEAL